MADWATILTSSGVASFVVFGGNAFLQHWKDVKGRDHVYFEIALQLESFAQRCHAKLHDVAEYLGERADRIDDKRLKQPESVKLEFAPPPDWKALPIKEVASIRSFPRRYANAHEWIVSQFNMWADTDEAYQFDMQILCYYGLKACEIAADIRKRLGVPEDAETGSLRLLFATEINERRILYRQHGDVINLIPELEAQFDAEQKSH